LSHCRGDDGAAPGTGITGVVTTGDAPPSFHSLPPDGMPMGCCGNTRTGGWLATDGPPGLAPGPGTQYPGGGMIEEVQGSECAGAFAVPTTIAAIANPPATAAYRPTTAGPRVLHALVL